MILQLADKLKFSVVAEGIETKEQCDWLQNAGCEVGQGYLFAKPMPLAETISWLHAQALK